ncbi:MAG TPA: phage tail sheath subtilisin-like domain-containing protein [Pseudoxanthomonas sp.]
MAISFDKIPSNLRTPGVYTEIDSSRAMRGVQLLQYRMLLLGQLTSAGTADPLVPVRVTSVKQARDLFGVGSMLAIMVEAALASNSLSELWCQPIEDAGSGVDAAGAVTFGGAPTEAGTISLYIGGKKVQIGATTTDTGASLATALAAAINAATTLPVTAAVDGTITSKVNITAKNAGEAGNGIDIRVGYYGESLPAGLTTTVAAMAGGTGNPDITAALAAVGDEWFQVVAMPYTDSANLALLETELESRFGPMREIEAHAFAAARGTHGALGTLGDARNSPHVCIVSAAYEPMPPFAKAAETAAIAAYYASIDPARPLQTLPYAYCLPPAEADRFTQEERNLLLFDGIATTNVDAGGVMRIERMVTTYKTNAAGADDTAYLDVETLFTLMTIRHDWRSTILAKYPRHKLASDGTRFAPGQAVVTPNVIKAEAVAKFREWEEIGLVEGFDQFKADLIVERNPSDPNRLDVLLPPDVINQLRLVATKIQFRL